MIRAKVWPRDEGRTHQLEYRGDRSLLRTGREAPGFTDIRRARPHGSDGPEIFYDNFLVMQNE